MEITLRKTAESDLAFVLEAENNRENSPFIGLWSKKEHERALSNKDIVHLIISDGEGRSVGYVILVGLESPNRSLELKRIVITEKGRGYGKKAIEFIKNMAFQTLGIHRVWLDVRSHNTRAKALYEKCGFVVEGLLRDNVFVDDHYESVYILSILKHEYFKA